jgi:hypothetical protein
LVWDFDKSLGATERAWGEVDMSVLMKLAPHVFVLEKTSATNTIPFGSEVGVLRAGVLHRSTQGHFGNAT